MNARGVVWAQIDTRSVVGREPDYPPLYYPRDAMGHCFDRWLRCVRCRKEAPAQARCPLPCPGVLPGGSEREESIECAARHCEADRAPGCRYCRACENKRRARWREQKKAERARGRA